MRRISPASLCFLTLFLFAHIPAWSEITISVTPPSPGGWYLCIGEENLAGGAGADFVRDYDTGAFGETLRIAGTADASEAWQVLVKRTDLSWDGDLVVRAQVLSLGTGTGSVSASGQALTVTDTWQTILNGSGDRNGILVRLKLSGVSIPRVSAGRYTTNLVYAVTALE